MTKKASGNNLFFVMNSRSPVKPEGVVLANKTVSRMDAAAEPPGTGRARGISASMHVIHGVS